MYSDKIKHFIRADKDRLMASQCSLLVVTRLNIPYSKLTYIFSRTIYFRSFHTEPLVRKKLMYAKT